MERGWAVIGYGSRTGTRRNLAGLRASGWRLLVSATGVWNAHGFRYGLDNGAWTAWQAGTAFDADRFRACVAAFGADADFIVVPDIVGGGAASLELSVMWLPWVLERTRLALLPVQDGLNADDLRPLLDPRRVGIFVGGTTEWKVATLPQWGALARETGCYLHVGRVNTARRIRLCGAVGVHSFDGTGVSRFALHLPRVERARSGAGQQREAYL